MARLVPSQVVAVIEQMFPKYIAPGMPGEGRSLSRTQSTNLAALIEILGQIPSELVVLETKNYIEFISSIAAIREMLETWKTDQTLTLQFIDGLPKLNPVRLIRDALAKCDDEAITAGTTELNFIKDDDEFRQLLRLDIAAVNHALANNEWKAATVLAGSVVEALLLWKLSKTDRREVDATAKRLTLKTKSNLEEWVLHEYIEVAADLKLIGKSTATHCRLAKDYRNLIHPGRAQRLGPCNRGTALSAVAAVESVVDGFNH